jgi:hypothetical protein
MAIESQRLRRARTKEFSLEDGERLVQELNRDYPAIQHELMRAPPPTLEPAAALAEEANEEEESQTHTGATKPFYALSSK